MRFPNGQIRDDESGFTLIELLVVVAIVGLLSSMISASVSNARARGRDARRLADLRQFQLAMELFYDQYGDYAGEGDTGGVHLSSKCASDMKTDLVDGGFLPAMIADPLDSNTDCADDSDGAFFYGWDSNHCCEGKWCVSINALETQWAADLLENQFGSLHYVTGGGDANIGTGDDFNYCFKKN